MKWNSWIIEHLFGIFVYGIETASLLITREIPSLLDNAYIVTAFCSIAYKVIAYKLLPTGLRFEFSCELDKIIMQ
jgi:hypothetical protein